MAGLSHERMFRLECQGRVVGRFRAVERASQQVALLDWAWERGARPSRIDKGVIVLADAAGADIRRWECGRIEQDGESLLVGQIRRRLA